MFIWDYAKNATLVPSKTLGKIGDVASVRENISPRQSPGLVSRKRILGEWDFHFSDSAWRVQHVGSLRPDASATSV